MDDLISRQAIYKMLDEISGDNPREAVVPIDSVADMIAELPTVAIPSAEAYKGMTNGEVIQALFPNGKVIERDEAMGYEQMLDDKCSYCSWFDGLWWNSSYEPQESESKRCMELAKSYVQGLRAGFAEMRYEDGRAKMDRLISLQTVIDTMNDWLANSTDDLDNLFERIKAVPSADKWIPVSERLPNDEDDVLFCDLFGHIRLGYHPGDWKSTHFAERGSWELQKNVAAWMHLPEPYKAQERGEE